MPVSFNVNLKTCFRSTAYKPSVMDAALEECMKTVTAEGNPSSIVGAIDSVYKSWYPVQGMHISQDRYTYFVALSMISTWILSFEELHHNYEHLNQAAIVTVEDYISLADKVKQMISCYYRNIFTFGYSVCMALPRLDAEFEDAFNYSAQHYNITPELNKTLRTAYGKLRAAMRYYKYSAD